METVVRRKSKWSEMAGVLLLSLSAALLLALATYSGADTSLNVASARDQYSNFAGKIGAYVSDLLLQVFGLAVFLLPLIVAVMGYRKLRSQSMRYPLLKIGVGLLVLVAMAAGIQVLGWPFALSGNFTPGGVVGIITASWLTAYLNRGGTIILLTTILLLSLLGATPFSFE
ncbi:MAG: DNA translocase FtsK 4TM domain-containing protein [Acidobacteriota bacterium]